MESSLSQIPGSTVACPERRKEDQLFTLRVAQLSGTFWVAEGQGGHTLQADGSSWGQFSGGGQPIPPAAGRWVYKPVKGSGRMPRAASPGP